MVLGVVEGVVCFGGLGRVVFFDFFLMIIGSCFCRVFRWEEGSVWF